MLQVYTISRFVHVKLVRRVRGIDSKTRPPSPDVAWIQVYFYIRGCTATILVDLHT